MSQLRASLDINVYASIQIYMSVCMYSQIEAVRFPFSPSQLEYKGEGERNAEVVACRSLPMSLTRLKR